MIFDNTLPLEQRVRILQDIEEIKTLKHLYCRYADIWGKPGQVDDFAALFSESGQLDVGLGVFMGPAAIAKGLREMSAIWKRCIHLCINPRIVVDGDTAIGNWYGSHPTSADQYASPLWMVGIYDEEYVRTPAGWRFQSVKERMALEPAEFLNAYGKVPS
jgi:SnoaL-like domain